MNPNTLIVAGLIVTLGAGVAYEYQQAQKEKTRAESAEGELDGKEAQLTKFKEFTKKLQSDLATANNLNTSTQAELTKVQAEARKSEAALENLQTQLEKAHSDLVDANQKSSSTSNIGAYDIKSMEDNLQSYNKYLTVIQGDQKRGCGFIIKWKNGRFLLTNANIISNNNNLKITFMNGKSFTPDAILLANGYDLVSISNSSLLDGIEIIPNVSDSVSIGDDVVVLGSAAGSGHDSLITARVTAIAPDQVEISGRFTPEISGSPVIHVNTGKVIGIASYSLTPQAPDLSTDPNLRRPSKVERRIVYRLDTVSKWDPINLDQFNKMGATCALMTARTDDLMALAKEMYNNRTGQIDYAKYYGANNSLHDLVQQFETDATVDTSDKSAKQKRYLMAKSSFCSNIIDHCTNDYASIDLLQFDSYHRSVLDDHKKIRDELVKIFKDIQSTLDATLGQ